MLQHFQFIHLTVFLPYGAKV